MRDPVLEVLSVKKMKGEGRLLQRRWPRVGVAILAALVLLTGGYAINATVVEQRSIQSRVIEDYFWITDEKAVFTDPEELTAELAAQAERDGKPLTIPVDMDSVALIEMSGMQVFEFGGAAKPGQKQILYLHGGGYIYEAIPAHFDMLHEISAMTGARILMPAYPLAPVHQFELAYEAVLRAYKDILTTVNPENLTVMGDSAGGGFALGLAQSMRQNNLPQPRHIILLSPWLDMTMSNPGIANLERNDPMDGTMGLVEIARKWAGTTDLRDPRLSPIYGPVSELGHITLFIGTRELFNADARKFRDIAGAAGVQITFIEKAKMLHVYPAMPTPEGAEARQQIAEVINGTKLG